MVGGYRLRSGDTHCVNGAAEFLRHTLNSLRLHLAVGLVRADSGFPHASVLDELELWRMPSVMATRLTKPIQSVCWHDDAAWEKVDMEGMEVHEIEAEQVGRRILVLRHWIARRLEAGWKMLLNVPGYRFQALVTNLLQNMKALAVWRRYNGGRTSRTESRNLGGQFGVKRLAGKGFWATESLHRIAMTAYNLWVLLQRRLGLEGYVQLLTLR